MFNFEWNWDWSGLNLDSLSQPEPVLDNTWLAQLERELAALSTVVTQTVVNSPVVVEAPVNVAPSVPKVEQVVQQVVQAVAPVIAPSVPDYIIQLSTPLFVDEIAYSPEVLSAPVGQTIQPKEVETIVQNIVNTATKDEAFVNGVVASIPDSVIQSLPEEVRPTVTEAVKQATEVVEGTGTLDLTNRKTGTLQQSDALRMANPSENVSQPLPSRFVNNPYLNATTLEPEAMAGSVTEQRLEAERIANIQKSIVPSEAEIKNMPASVRKELREQIAAQTEKQTTETTEILNQLENSINEYTSSFDTFLADVEAAEAAATSAAAAAAAAEKEGDKTVVDLFKSGGASYKDLPPVFQDLINQQPQYKTATNAGIAAAVSVLQSVGVQGLADTMAQIRDLYPDISSEDALMLLKFDKRFNEPYLNRFSGNRMLMNAGFAPLDDKEYLATEKAFNKIFTAYDLKQFNNNERFASLIGNRISAEELATRVSTAYDRVIKGAGETRRALNQLFPELNDSDILAYAIDPVNQLPAIQRKVQAAEIGGAALAQNLSIGLQNAPVSASGYSNVQRAGMSVEQLMAQGIDLDTARKGFARVADVLPTAEKLSAIYGDRLGQYGRKQAEEEQFTSLASAKRAREKLSEAEQAAFGGSAGRLRATRQTAAGII